MVLDGQIIREEGGAGAREEQGRSRTPGGDLTFLFDGGGIGGGNGGVKGGDLQNCPVH